MSIRNLVIIMMFILTLFSTMKELYADENSWVAEEDQVYLPIQNVPVHTVFDILKKFRMITVSNLSDVENWQNYWSMKSLIEMTEDNSTCGVFQSIWSSFMPSKEQTYVPCSLNAYHMIKIAKDNKFQLSYFDRDYTDKEKQELIDWAKENVRK